MTVTLFYRKKYFSNIPTYTHLQRVCSLVLVLYEFVSPYYTGYRYLVIELLYLFDPQFEPLNQFRNVTSRFLRILWGLKMKALMSRLTQQLETFYEQDLGGGVVGIWNEKERRKRASDVSELRSVISGLLESVRGYITPARFISISFGEK